MLSRTVNVDASRELPQPHRRRALLTLGIDEADMGILVWLRVAELGPLHGLYIGLTYSQGGEGGGPVCLDGGRKPLVPASPDHASAGSQPGRGCPPPG